MFSFRVPPPTWPWPVLPPPPSPPPPLGGVRERKKWNTRVLQVPSEGSHAARQNCAWVPGHGAARGKFGKAVQGVERAGDPDRSAGAGALFFRILRLLLVQVKT